MTTNDHTPNTPLKRCSKCGKAHPATSEYFYFSNNGKIKTPCKRCQILAATQWYQDHHQPKNNDIPEGFRKCSRCNEIFPCDHHFFDRSSKGKNGLDARCKNCKSILAGYSGRRSWPPIIIPDGFRRCSKCKEIKPLPEFTRNSQKPSGYASRCKTCTNAYAKDFNNSHPGMASRKAKEFRAKNPQYVIDWNKKYYRDHAEDRRAASRNWKANNPNKVKAQESLYRKIIKQRYRARKLSMSDAFFISDWRSALAYFNGCCAVCGRPPGLWHTIAADHWIPLSDPRPDNPGTVPTNIVPLCHGIEGCNNSKSNRDPVEWLVERFGARKTKAILKRINAYFDSLKEKTDAIYQ